MTLLKVIEPMTSNVKGCDHSAKLQIMLMRTKLPFDPRTLFFFSRSPLIVHAKRERAYRKINASAAPQIRTILVASGGEQRRQSLSPLDSLLC